MPFQKGHKLSPKGKPPEYVSWQNTLQRAIKQDNAQRVRDACEKLLDLAAAGEQWAVRELADRLDGKAKQQIEAKVDASVTFNETVAKAEELRKKVRGNS